MTHERYAAVDYLAAHGQEPSAVLFKARTTEWTYFLQPLGGRVWAAVLSLPLVVVLLTWFLTSRFQPSRSHDDQDHIVGRMLFYRDCIFGAYGILVKQGLAVYKAHLTLLALPLGSDACFNFI